MANIQIYSQEANQNYTVTLNVYSTVTEGTTDGKGEYYMTISTNYQHQGASFPVFVIKDLTDIAPTAPAATNFSDLVKGYLDYYINYNIMESSSSSSSEGISESSSSSLSSQSSLSSDSTSSSDSSSDSSLSESSSSST